MNKTYILVFLVQNVKLGISINATQSVIRALEVTPLPGAPSIVDGIINLSGNTIPVLNIRKRLKLNPKKINPADKVLVIKTEDITFAYFTDDVIGLKEIDFDKINKSADMLPGTNVLVDGICVIENEIVFIHDVNKFLSLKEKQKLKNALSDKQSVKE